MNVLIESDGTVTTLYDERLDLQALGALKLTRASHVDPDSEGQWWAQLIQGPTLGPFPNRSAALAAEVDWLNRHRLGG
jgi:hypothetical protein